MAACSWASPGFGFAHAGPAGRISIISMAIYIAVERALYGKLVGITTKDPAFFEAALAGFVYRNFNFSMRTAQLSGFTFTSST